MNRAGIHSVLSQASGDLARLTKWQMGEDSGQKQSPCRGGERTAKGWPQHLMPAPCSQLGWRMGHVEHPNCLPSASLSFRDVMWGGLWVQILMGERSV